MSAFFVHPSAIVDQGAIIGKGSKIWHFTHIMPEAVIGENCTIGQNVFIANEVTIGNNVKIQNNVSLYTGVVCEDDVFLGPSVVFTNVKNPRSAVSRKNEFIPTIIKQGASIGANATIVCGLVLGRFSFIGAGAVVTKDVPDYAVFAGNPAAQIGWMSEYGVRLEFDEKGYATCSESGKKYFLNESKVTGV